MLKSRFFVVWAIVMMVFGQMVSCVRTSSSVKRRVITDTIFYNEFKRIVPLKIPTAFNLEELDLDNYYVHSEFTNKYICEYENFCQLHEVYHTGSYKGKELNDSIYVLTYWVCKTAPFTESPQFILSIFNINRSDKPVSKLVLQDKYEGWYELRSFIDSNFVITTTKITSSRDKPHPNRPKEWVNLDLELSNYRLLPSGNFQLVGQLSATFDGRQPSFIEHFKYNPIDTLRVLNEWKFDTQGRKISTFLNGDRGILKGNNFILTDTTFRSNS